MYKNNGVKGTQSKSFGRQNITYSVISGGRLSKAPKPCAHNKLGTNTAWLPLVSASKQDKDLEKKSASYPDRKFRNSHMDSFITACMNRVGNPFLKITFCRESQFYQGSTNPHSEQLVTKTRSYLPSISIKLPQGLWSLINWYFALKANRKESKILCQMQPDSC